MAETTLNQRVEIYISSKKLSGSELSKRWHVSKQAVSNWLNGHSQIPIKYIMNMAIEYPELNLRWLMTGVGEMESEVVKAENQDSALAKKDGMIELLIQQASEKDKKIAELMKELGRLEAFTEAKN